MAMLSTRGRKLGVAALGALILLLILGKIGAEMIVELYWFRSLGLADVFWIRWAASLGTRAVAALLIGGFVFANLWVVSRSLGAIRVRRRFGNIEIAEKLPDIYVYGALLAISLFSAWWLSAAMPDALATLGALRPVDWGVTDPYFQRDISYYVFRLPLLGRLQTLAGLTVFWAALLSAAAYVATGSVRLAENEIGITPAARRHLGVLAGIFLLCIAWDFWLDRYGLVVSGNGVGGALGYTDANVRLPANLVMTLVTAAAGLAIAYYVWHNKRVAAIGAAAAVVLGFFAAELLAPALVQKLAVEPNEFEREQPYIERHLEFTRLAYGIDDLQRTTYPYRDASFDEAELITALNRVPLWDERPLLQVFRQRQSLFPYYDFVSVFADRYGPLNNPQQVAIAVREIDVAAVSPSTRTWQNLHLNPLYMAGRGAVVSPSAAMARDGTPVFHLSDLDPARLSPEAPPGLQLEQPEIYFGQNTHDYIITSTNSAPLGVPIDATWKKWLFAWAFQSRNLLFSDEVSTDSSVIVYRREVPDRAAVVAPFLRFLDEGGLQPVISGGRLVWLADGFTTSPHFPLAALAGLRGMPLRYARNSVKATIDGLTGEVRYYAVDDDDPVLQTFAQWFPDLIRPASEMPPELQRHLRYPPAMQQLQVSVLGEYHLTDARRFYAKQDVWSMATETYRNESVPALPIYATMRLPGEQQPEFVMSVPFTAAGRQNMTALLIARNDPPHYGEQILYELPRDELVPGPQQVESMIDQNPEISQQLALWKRGGSEVIRGHVVIVPIDSTLVYMEPIFLEAQSTAIPQLERIVLATAGTVVMRPTLAEAVAALVAAASDDGERVSAIGETAAADGAQIDTGDISDPVVLQRARDILQRADAELRAGDWAAFGRSWDELRELVGAAQPAGGS